MLNDYETLNHDLPDPTKRWMALFVLAPKVGMKVLEELFERNLGLTFIKHRSWMWYTAMRHSGLERHWDNVAAYHNSGASMFKILTTLRDLATPEEWLLLSRRLGVPVFKDRALLSPSWYNRQGTDQAIWTKGGTWDRRNNFTKIIVLGEHLERDHTFSNVSRRLSKDQARSLESEVFRLVNQDDQLYPDAINSGVGYVRYRIPELIARRQAPSSFEVASWFFQTMVPVPGGRFVNYLNTQRGPRTYKTSSGSVKDWRWLPSC